MLALRPFLTLMPTFTSVLSRSRLLSRSCLVSSSCLISPSPSCLPSHVDGLVLASHPIKRTAPPPEPHTSNVSSSLILHIRYFSIFVASQYSLPLNITISIGSSWLFGQIYSHYDVVQIHISKLQIALEQRIPDFDSYSPASCHRKYDSRGGPSA